MKPSSTLTRSSVRAIRHNAKSRHQKPDYFGTRDGTLFTFLAYILFIGSAFIGSSAVLKVGIMYVS